MSREVLIAAARDVESSGRSIRGVTKYLASTMSPCTILSRRLRAAGSSRSPTVVLLAP